MRVMLMRTCLADHVAPSVVDATRRLLEGLGVEVEVPRAQTCCGQPGWTAGHPDRAREVARQCLRAFAGPDPVVVPSGSCAAMVVHGYPQLFDGCPEAASAADMAGRTFELTAFLRDHGLVPTAPSDAPPSVTHHDSCHMLRMLHEHEAPRAVLAAAGVEVRELPDADVCCGFGGAFSLAFPEVSGALGAQKAQNAAATGADTLVGCDLSCLMHIAGCAHREGIALRVRHVAEVLEP